MKAVWLTTFLAGVMVVGVGGASTGERAITWDTVAWGRVFAGTLPCTQTWSGVLGPCAVLVTSRSGSKAEAVAKTGGNGEMAKLLRAFDFKRYVFVAVFSNQRPTGADQIEIRSIRRAGRTLQVGAVILECRSWPGVAACTADAPHVYHVVKVPRARLSKPYPTVVLVEQWVRPVP